MALSGHTKLQRHDAAVQRHTQPRLCVSVNTIRTHMRHVYGRLDAHGRQEAVKRYSRGSIPEEGQEDPVNHLGNIFFRWIASLE